MEDGEEGRGRGSGFVTSVQRAHGRGLDSAESRGCRGDSEEEQPTGFATRLFLGVRKGKKHGQQAASWEKGGEASPCGKGKEFSLVNVESMAPVKHLGKNFLLHPCAPPHPLGFRKSTFW